MGNPQSQPNVLYYGNPAASNFDSGGKNAGKAVSAPIELPTGVEVSIALQIYIDTESGNSYDNLWMRIITPSETILLIQKSNLTTKQWKKFNFDLSYLGGQTIQIEFEFDSKDGIANTGLGVLIDDISIGTSCEPKTCTNNNGCVSKFKCTAGSCVEGVCEYIDSCCSGDDECDDDKVCTTDTCTNGQCLFKEIAGCCESDFDCDDKNACTLDLCSGFGGTCENNTIDGCCLSNKDCDDQDTCTIDTCDENACSYTNVCCADDSECNDGDDVCTEDKCVDSFCQYIPTGVEGCCEENPVTWDFESPLDFIFNETKPPCSWQIADAGKAKSGSGSLYYGDIIAGNYSCGGANEGSATTESITLLPGFGYTLTFHVYMATEASNSYDKLFVYIHHEGKKMEVWNKSKLGGTNSWKTHTLNLNAFAGKTFHLEFFFDTIDGVLNSYAGVFIDDFSITSTCASVTCANNGNCNDGIGQTSDTCDAGVCTYSL